MTVDEYHSLPHEFGWKYEYLWNKLYRQPRHIHAKVKRRVTCFQSSSGIPTRPVQESDLRQLVRLDFESFRDTVEYCNWRVTDIGEAARKTIHDFFAGRRGAPFDGSRVALDPDRRNRITGAILLVQSRQTPTIDLLMVAPDRQRCGVATALLNEVLNGLHAQGVAELRSAYDVANTASVE